MEWGEGREGKGREGKEGRTCEIYLTYKEDLIM